MIYLSMGPCDKVVWNDFALRRVCAGPERVEGTTPGIKCKRPAMTH